MGFLAIQYYNPLALNTSRISKPLGELRDKYSYLLTSVVIIFGMQTIRVAFPIAVWHLSSAVYPLLLLMTLSFLTPLFAFLLKSKKFLTLTVGGLALTRILEVLIRNADADLWLSMLGASFFALSLPLLLRPRISDLENRSSGSWAGGLLIGLALDTTIKGIFWTNNLGAGQNPIAILIQILLTVLALTLLLLSQERNEVEKIDRSWPGAILLISIGPFFLLQLLIFQNQGYISEVFGIGLPQAFIVVAFGNLASVIGLYIGNFKFSTPSFIGFFAAIILGASILSMEYSHPLISLVMILAQFTFGWGFSRIAMRGSHANINHLIRTSIVIGFSQILFASLLLISFGNLALSVDFPSDSVMSVLAILMGGTVLLADQMMKRDNLEPSKKPSLILITIVLFLTSIVHSIVQISKTSSEVAVSLPVRVMTYNIHSAVSNNHGQDLEAIAQVIERSGSDIIAIQEISRGWLISGGIDMVSWLSNRLGMEAIFAGNADTLWGNSILSRYPIVESGSGSLPMLDSQVPRGYIWAKIDVGETSPLMIINTHLQNGSEEQHVRLAQVPELLNAWGNSTSSILLGDLNATPGTEEQNLIMNSGLIDSWEEVSTETGNTAPAHQPSIRLDWIWHTRDLVAIEVQVISTTASDHLPVIALIDFVSP